MKELSHTEQALVRPYGIETQNGDVETVRLKSRDGKSMSIMTFDVDLAKKVLIIHESIRSREG